MYLCHLILLQLLYLFPVAFSNDSTCGALFGSNSGAFDEGDIDFKLSEIQVVSPGDVGLVFSWNMFGADPSALQIIRLLLNCSSFQVRKNASSSIGSVSVVSPLNSTCSVLFCYKCYHWICYRKFGPYDLQAIVNDDNEVSSQSPVSSTAVSGLTLGKTSASSLVSSFESTASSTTILYITSTQIDYSSSPVEESFETLSNLALPPTPTSSHLTTFPTPTPSTNIIEYTSLTINDRGSIRYTIVTKTLPSSSLSLSSSSLSYSSSVSFSSLSVSLSPSPVPLNSSVSAFISSTSLTLVATGDTGRGAQQTDPNTTTQVIFAVVFSIILTTTLIVCGMVTWSTIRRCITRQRIAKKVQEDLEKTEIFLLHITPSPSLYTLVSPLETVTDSHVNNDTKSEERDVSSTSTSTSSSSSSSSSSSDILFPNEERKLLNFPSQTISTKPANCSSSMETLSSCESCSVETTAVDRCCSSSCNPSSATVAPSIELMQLEAEPGHSSSSSSGCDVSSGSSVAYYRYCFIERSEGGKETTGTKLENEDSGNFEEHFHQSPQDHLTLHETTAHTYIQDCSLNSSDC